MTLGDMPQDWWLSLSTWRLCCHLVTLSTTYCWAGARKVVPRPLCGSVTTCSVFSWGETWWLSNKPLLILFLTTILKILWWLWPKHYCAIWWMTIPGSQHSWVWPSMLFRLTWSFGHTALEHCFTCGNRCFRMTTMPLCRKRHNKHLGHGSTQGQWASWHQAVLGSGTGHML